MGGGGGDQYTLQIKMSSVSSLAPSDSPKFLNNTCISLVPQIEKINRAWFLQLRSHLKKLSNRVGVALIIRDQGVRNELFTGRREGNCCTDTQNKCWRHFLKDFMTREVVNDEKDNPKASVRIYLAIIEQLTKDDIKVYGAVLERPNSDLYPMLANGNKLLPKTYLQVSLEENQQLPYEMVMRNQRLCFNRNKAIQQGSLWIKLMSSIGLWILYMEEHEGRECLMVRREPRGSDIYGLGIDAVDCFCPGQWLMMSAS
ncbi:hypothetical protein HAX54_008583 [Datura stramonium]|uniref:Uncharacterized protein n=1 Tax=Datura stramonium TaxID=4076 RepID=A0ABS8RVL2_DATST|nr:hypothetical protein [Datura stramonium]